MFLKWQDKFRVGVERFDSQHKVLVKMINNLHEAILTGKSAEAVEQVINELVEYTHTHFDAEEALMVEHSYPEYEVHKDLHKDFTTQVNILKGDFEDHKEGVPADVMEALVEWFLNHIFVEDNKYATFFNGKGIS